MHAALIASLAALIGVGEARAAPDTVPDEAPEDYGDAGAAEVGGSLGLSWTRERLDLRVAPSVGWFVADRVELSVVPRISYARPRGGPGAFSGGLLIEPSFHQPLTKDEAVFVFGGLGVGAGHDGVAPDLEIVPRVGLNVPVGASGVLTPAVRVPVLLGPGEGAAGRKFGASAGIAFDLGVTTVW